MRAGYELARRDAPAGPRHPGPARVGRYIAAVRPPRTLPPALGTEIPGPRSRALAARLARVESRNVTCVAPEPPIFWERAAGANVWDADGNRFVDLGAGFGVASAGHGHPRVVAALAAQGASLLHAMGDVHPAAVKVELLERLAALFPGGGPARVVLGSSGSDAVEAALETAVLATGRAGVVAFEGAYHGLSLGALDATWRPEFREPFAARLPGATVFARFGDVADVSRAARAARQPVGAVLVEPIQGRGGERIPPDGFLAGLRALCDREGWLLVADEVYTGLGRTGRTWAVDHEGVVPDLLCVGKALAGGLPISACVGRASLMDAWPASTGESLHTQTFLGHPPSCAAALAALAVLAEEKLAARAAELGPRALAHLRAGLATLLDDQRVREVRGRGLLIGIECDGGERALDACREALRRGVIAIPSGDAGEVISVTPPLTIEEDALLGALDILAAALRAGGAGARRAADEQGP
jgi:4-aminobutyrate aminotransferase/(S)-3-amino-2-methylpropionate transaminase